MNALLIGFGTIARALCTLKLPFNSMIIIDKVDLSEYITKYFKEKDSIGTNIIKQIKFINLKITKDKLKLIYDIITENEINIIIDCAYNIDTYDLLNILPPNVSYINTSVEEWEENEDIPTVTTIKERHDKIKKWYNKIKPTNNILLDCGMNPGLISLWAYDCCEKMNFDQNEITQCIISEIDMQRAKIPRTEGEFVSTWCPNNFMEEIHSPLEGYSLGIYYVNNKVTGYETISKSLRPNGQIFYGYTIRHSETITLKKFFPNATLMYIYRCPNEAVSSLFEYQDMKPVKIKRIILSDDIIDGSDEIGILMSDGRKLVWYGSVLSNDDIKSYPMSNYVNTTSYQVACGLWIGIYVLQYYRDSKTSQLMTSEDIIKCPLFEYLLETVNKYLKIEFVEFENTKTIKHFMKNKSFEQHFVNKNNND
ncbi:homospermidine synthase [Tupanvirus deep ocean]|uniref:Homospermidine synthase n=2 Tax=Tupanvirus TaxID=2094720 RepID=A0AC62A7X7_9VIRU|nr:homospermidine synthase [Tupanvirus deep ocean]QKU33886.1 homospermidine synthase [Tupanvirus deep ocean]